MYIFLLSFAGKLPHFFAMLNNTLQVEYLCESMVCPRIICMLDHQTLVSTVEICITKSEKDVLCVMTMICANKINKNGLFSRMCVCSMGIHTRCACVVWAHTRTLSVCVRVFICIYGRSVWVLRSTFSLIFLMGRSK